VVSSLSLLTRKKRYFEAAAVKQHAVLVSLHISCTSY